MKIRTKHSLILLIIFISLISFQIISSISQGLLVQSYNQEKELLVISGMLGKLQGNTYDLQTTMNLDISYDNWIRNKKELTLAVEEVLYSPYYTEQKHGSHAINNTYEDVESGWEYSSEKLNLHGI